MGKLCCTDTAFTAAVKVPVLVNVTGDVLEVEIDNPPTDICAILVFPAAGGTNRKSSC